MFLLFNIGLELSFDRLARMGKMVFGMGTAQARHVFFWGGGREVGFAFLPACLHQPYLTAPWCRSHLLSSEQVVLTLAAVAYTGMALSGGALGGPAAIILGGGLALSTTAVGMQVGGWGGGWGGAVGGWRCPRQWWACRW